MNNIRNILTVKGLKITPQRIAILQSVRTLQCHPTAENIIDCVQSHNPNIAIGTIYKTLETFVAKGIIIKIETEDDKTRYDGILEKHHHLHCTATDKIGDYYDTELDELLNDYFAKKEISGFAIDDIRLHIDGKFINSNY